MAGFKSTLGVTQVRLDWDPVASATQYKVYRNGSFLANTNTNMYYDMTVSPNTTYSYYVNSVVASVEATATTTINVTTLDNIDLNKLYDYPDLSTMPTQNYSENIEGENLNLTSSSKLSVNYSPQDSAPAYTVQKYVTSAVSNTTKNFNSIDRTNFIIENDSEIDFVSGAVQIKGDSGTVVTSTDINFNTSDKSQYVLDSKADIVGDKAVIKSGGTSINLSGFTKVWYVDPTSGNDTTGTGTTDLPYATINKAITSASSGDAVYLKKGTYNPTLVNSTIYSSAFSVFNIENKDLTFIGEGKDTKVIRTGSSYADTHRCYMVGYYQSTVKFYNINFIMSGTNTFTNTYASVFCQGLYNGSTTTGQTASNVSFYNCSVTSDLTTSNTDLIMYFCKTETIAFENCFIDLKSSSFTTPHYYYATTGTHTFKNVAYKVYNNGTVGSSLSSGTLGETTCLTTFTYDTDYYLISGTWKNAGTGVNADSTVANIGVYGGLYGWISKADTVKSTYLNTGANQIVTTGLLGIDSIITTQTAGAGTKTTVIPAMTSATTPTGYVASASNNYDTTNYREYKAFDQSETYYWCTATGTTTGWLSIDLPAFQTIVSYSLKCITGAEAPMPKTWTFEGYNIDTASWVVLDTRTNVSFANSTPVEFALSSPATYKTYRINVTANNGATFLGIGEMQLYSQPTSSVKYLVSFDNKATWKAWTGSAWTNVTLANINSSGMTKAVLESVTISQWSQVFTAGTLDVAVGMFTTDLSTYSPTVDKITINYDVSEKIVFNSTTESSFVQENASATDFLSNKAILSPTITTSATAMSTAGSTYTSSSYFSNNSTYDASKAFNGTLNEIGWVSNDACPQWVQVQLTAEKVIGKYLISPRPDMSSNPTSWKLQGSLDGLTYVDLDTQTNITDWVANTSKTFNIPNNTIGYKYYRLYVTDSNNVSKLVSVGELQLFENTTITYTSTSSYITTGTNGISTIGRTGIKKISVTQADGGIMTVSTVPTLTSNTSASPIVVSESSAYSNNLASYGAWHAFDNVWDKNNNGGSWFTNAPTAVGAWISVDYGAGNSKIITKVRYQHDGAVYPGGARIATFKFQGSNDMSAWTDIQTITTANSTPVQEFVINNTTAYRGYRIYGTSAYGTDTYAGICEVQLMETVPSTQVKYLVSFDNKTTWKTWNGSSWSNVTLANIHTSGMTKATIEGITQSQWSTIFATGKIDIAVGLKINGGTATPSISQVAVTFDNSLQTYPICDSYIATGTNQLNSSNWTNVNTITVTQNEPVGTSVRYLVSFDNKATWKSLIDNTWTNVILADIHNQGMTKATLESVNQAKWNEIFATGTFDYAIGLKTTDTSQTPSVSAIVINHTDASAYVTLTAGELASYTITHVQNDNGAYVTTEITNNTGLTQSIKLIISTLAKAGSGNYYLIFANLDGSYTCLRTQSSTTGSYCTFSSPNIINIVATGALNTFRYDISSGATSWGYVTKTSVGNDLYYLKPNAQLVYSNYNLIDSTTSYIKHLANTMRPSDLSTQDITTAGTGVLRTNLADMQIGDYIACKYTATVGTVGTFSNLGGTITTQIPLNGHTKPDGYFYFVKVAKGTLIADRVIQTAITWNTLNTAKAIQGFPVTLNSINCLIRSIGSGIGYIASNGTLTATNSSLGAFPSSNEWDKYVIKSSLKGKVTAGDDKIWHYNGMFSLGQDIPSTLFSANSIYMRISRGFINCCLDVCLDTDNTMLNCGFRPVLEFKEDNSNLWY